MKIEKVFSEQIALERCVLANCIYYPKESWHWARFFPVGAKDFTDPTHAYAFTSFLGYMEGLGDKEPDADDLNRIIYTSLGIDKDVKACDALADCSSAINCEVCVKLHELAKEQYGRDVKLAMDRVRSVGDCQNVDAYNLKLDCARNSVPKPRNLPNSVAAAQTDATQGDIKEISPRLLYVPGFIDELMEYTLKTAYMPNPTLAFAGALALLAHLSGRQFSAMNEHTWPNLYVFALADSGQGKDHPRSVNKKILWNCRMGDTVYEDVTSGPGLEDAIKLHSTLLMQMDEVQKVVQAMGDAGLNDKQTLSGALMRIFTSSNDIYTLRLKANMTSIPPPVDHPSLTLFATGNAKGVYEKLKPEFIEEGFVGRCLMFDTDLDVRPNFSIIGQSKKKIELPKRVTDFAEEMSNANIRQQGGPVRAKDVPIEPEAEQKLADAWSLCFDQKIVCKKKDDLFGKAIWARASEKVSKLALLYAISENYIEPKITCAAVDWAKALTVELVNRMTKRIEEWMANGDVDRLCKSAIRYLRKHGGCASRHDIFRNINAGSDDMMKKVENSLVAAQLITIERVAKNRFIFNLIGKK